VEETPQEDAVEVVETVRAARLANSLKTASQVVRVAVQESAPLDEVDEHQTVQHERRIPVDIRGTVDTLDETLEVLQFLLKMVVEALGHLLSVERALHAVRNERDRETFLLIQPELERAEPLKHRLAGLARAVGVLSAGVGRVRFAPHPLPHLFAPRVIYEHDQVFESVPGDLCLDLTTDRMARNPAISRLAQPHDEPLLFGNRRSPEV